LRQEAGDKLRVTVISPVVKTNFAEDVTNPDVRAQIAASKEKLAMPPDAIARTIMFAIEQPPDVDVNEILIRPTSKFSFGYGPAGCDLPNRCNSLSRS